MNLHYAKIDKSAVIAEKFRDMIMFKRCFKAVFLGCKTGGLAILGEVLFCYTHSSQMVHRSTEIECYTGQRQ